VKSLSGPATQNFTGSDRRKPVIQKIMDLNELTYKVNGAVFEVNKVLGSGFLEKVYENALLVELKKNGPCESV
jgi:hypothetical protein